MLTRLLPAALLWAAMELAAQPVPFLNTPTVPETASPGGRGFTLTVNGTGFSTNSVVRWNRHARATTFVNEMQLTAKILAEDIATASTATVTVATSGSPGHISNPVFFSITTPEPFVAAQTVQTGLSGYLTVSADLNGDGITDLVLVPPFIENNILVALAKGGGQFGSAQNYAVSGTPAFAVAGDFNNDGLPDLAVATTSGIDILYNTGGGAFGPPELISESYFTTLAVGDFNGDGRLDLVAGLNDAVIILLQVSDRRFAKPVYYADNNPTWIAVGDFNHDNALDLAVLNFDDSISIMLGNGDGTFQPATIYQTGGISDFPTTIVAADFNGDGNLDLARAAGLDTAGAGVLLGNGDGIFQPVVNNLGSSYGMVAADFNGDGKIDLAVGANAPVVGIYLGNGNGTFQPVQNGFGLGQVTRIAMGDFNQNGRMDLVVNNDSQIELLLQ